MRLASARDLKADLLTRLVDPFAARVSRLRRTGAIAVAAAAAFAGLEPDDTVFGIGARPFDTLPEIQRSIALGVARRGREYRLAVRVQRPSLARSPLMDRITRGAKGEVDVRIVGRIDKRAKPWHQRNTRPLLIGASVGHVDVTAGSIGAFVRRGGKVFILSNNHVLANEGLAKTRDWMLQRGAYDGGAEPDDRVARLRFWIALKTRGVNLVDAALAEIRTGIAHDPSRLRAIVNGKDKALKGLGPDFVDEGETVYKIGRTTGATRGRVSAFDVDNVVVNYDAGNLRFDNQIEIEGAGAGPFSDGGDSGALIVNAAMDGVALLFAGGDSGGSNGLGLTYGNPLRRVLRDLKATLLS